MNDINSDEAEITPPAPENDHEDSHEYRTLANGILSPRHRRLCQLAAQGLSNQKIAEELGYVGSRVSILLKKPAIEREIRALQERIFEETIQTRLKSFAESALTNIQMILTDETRAVKVSEKMALSQWVIEKLDGKASQKLDVGENLLAVLMDRLDTMKTAGRAPSESSVIDVTPHPALPSSPAGAETKELTEEDILTDWVVRNT